MDLNHLKFKFFKNKNVKSEYDDMQRRFAFRETLAMRNGFRTFSAPSIPADAGAAKRISRATCLGGKFFKKKTKQTDLWGISALTGKSRTSADFTRILTWFH